MSQEEPEIRRPDHLERHYEEHLQKAWQQVGRFLFYFARMEAKINEILGIIFGIHEKRLVEVLGQNMDISRKLSIIESSLPAADRSSNWKRSASKVMIAVRKINNPSRTMIAHSEFIGYPHGVEFNRSFPGTTKLKLREIWEDKDFDNACDLIRKTTDQLEFIRLALAPVDRRTFAGLPYSHESHLEPADPALLDLDHTPSKP